MSPKEPQVAHIEDYDSDAGHVKAGSRVEARRGSTAGATVPVTTTPTAPATNRSPQKATLRSKPGVPVTKDGASDSGYSSHASSALASIGSVTAEALRPVSAMQTTVRTSKPASPSRRPAMPRVNTTMSQRSERSLPTTRTASPTKRTGECDNLLCQHATCRAIRYPPRPNPTAQPPPLYPVHYMNGMAQHYQQQPQTPQYAYAQIPQLPQPSGGLTAGPRPRAGSMAGGQRPMSYHGHTYPGAVNPHHGPPPSQSAYHTAHYLAQGQNWPQVYQQQMAQYPMAPPSQPTMYPNAAHPPSPVTPRLADVPRSYSARMVPPAAPAPEPLPRQQVQQLQLQAPLNRAISARSYTSNTPGTFPGGAGEEESETSDSETTSESSESSCDSEHEIPVRHTRRDSRPSMSSAVAPRPSFRTRRTSDMPDHSASARDYIRRSRAIEAVPDHPSSSDNMDSDRTARAVVDRRTQYTTSARRRPSIPSSHSSRGRDSGRETSREAEVASRSSRIAAEERYHARLAEIEQAERMRQREREEHLELLDKVAAYQNAVVGAPVPDLTAEVIQQQNRRHRMSGSHITPSQHSSGSSNVRSRVQSSTSDGIKIEAGGTVLHLSGDTNFQLVTGDDGAPRIVVRPNGSTAGVNQGSASVGNGDSAYAGSSSQKSSSSRHGRSRVGSSISRRRDTVLDDGYSSRR